MTPESRRPIPALPRELPIEGEVPGSIRRASGPDLRTPFVGKPGAMVTPTIVVDRHGGFEEPASAFTRGYLDRPEMDFLKIPPPAGGKTPPPRCDGSRNPGKRLTNAANLCIGLSSNPANILKRRVFYSHFANSTFRRNALPTQDWEAGGGTVAEEV
jgi:hypothetical protein